MNNFFILGLPRSRTMWFSEFFTYDGVTCLHEHLSPYTENKLLEGVRGYADTNPLMTRNYGDNPVLIIERDKKAIIDSILTSFDPPQSIKCWKNTVTNIVTNYQNMLDLVQPKLCMRINFEDINDSLVVISQFLLPDKPVNEKRIEAYQNKIIKTDNRDITKTYMMNNEVVALNLTKQYDLLDVKRITDYQVAQNILDQCWYEVTEDNTELFIPNIVSEYWMGLYNGSEIVGCYRLHQVNNATYKGHVFMLPKYRKNYSKTGMYSILRWVMYDLQCQKIIVEVPEKFKNVMEFLESFDFVHEGINRQSYTKDGKLWDIHCYGLTKKEIWERIKWDR